MERADGILPGMVDPPPPPQRLPQSLLAALFITLLMTSCGPVTVVINSSNLTITASDRHRWHWTETCPGNQQAEGLVAVDPGSSAADTVLFWSRSTSVNGTPPTSGDITLNPGTYDYMGVLPPNTRLSTSCPWSITLTQEQ